MKKILFLFLTLAACQKLPDNRVSPEVAEKRQDLFTKCVQASKDTHECWIAAERLVQ